MLVPVRVTRRAGRGRRRDLPVVRGQGSGLVLRDEVQVFGVRPLQRRVVDGMVTDDEQHPAGPHRGGQPPVLRYPEGTRQVQEVLRDEVVRRRFGCPLAEVRLLPGDSRCRCGIGVGGVPGRSVEGDLRHVDRGHRPALLRQPDGVGTLAAADLQGHAGGAPGDVLHQPLVGPSAPEGVGRAVTLVPELRRMQRRRVEVVVVVSHAGRFSPAWRVTSTRVASSANEIPNVSVTWAPPGPTSNTA